MIVRKATADDVPRLMGYAQSFAEYHPLLRMFGYEPGAIERMLNSLIKRDDACLLTHEHGVLGGVMSYFWAAPKTPVATELFWWSEGKGGGDLLSAFEAWAREEGAELIQMLKVEGVRDVSQIYLRRGYEPVETAFVSAV